MAFHSNSNTLMIAISTKALFNLDKEEEYFQKFGLKKFIDRQKKMEEIPFEKGPAFPLVRSLLSLNQPGEEPLVEVVILSGQHPDTGIRVNNSVVHHGLYIERSGYTGGSSIIPYLEPFKIDLLLSRSKKDVQSAIDIGIPAAEMFDYQHEDQKHSGVIKLAFDGDGVLFSEESEIIFKKQGYQTFEDNEVTKANIPLPEGPLGKLIKSLQKIKTLKPDLLRIALITARGAPAHERPLRTFRAWGIDVDETFFLGGMPKKLFVESFGPAIFFDDQERHLTGIKGVPLGKIPYRSTSPLHADNISTINDKPTLVITSNVVEEPEPVVRFGR